MSRPSLVSRSETMRSQTERYALKTPNGSYMVFPATVTTRKDTGFKRDMRMPNGRRVKLVRVRLTEV